MRYEQALCCWLWRWRWLGTTTAGACFWRLEGYTNKDIAVGRSFTRVLELALLGVDLLEESLSIFTDSLLHLLTWFGLYIFKSLLEVILRFFPLWPGFSLLLNGKYTLLSCCLCHWLAWTGFFCTLDYNSKALECCALLHSDTDKYKYYHKSQCVNWFWISCV